MSNLNIIAIFVAIVAASTAVDLDSQWKEFKATYSKKYTGPAEEAYRRGIWEGHLEYIAVRNSAYKRGDVSYYLAENEFADMSNSEFVKLMTRYNMENDTADDTAAIFAVGDQAAPLPDTIDWRKYGYVTPVRKQGPCASGYAFASVGAIEGQMYRKFKSSRSLSPQNIIDCSGNAGCLGGCMKQSYNYVISRRGIDTDEAYPYEAKRLRTCRYDSSKGAVGGFITGFTSIKRYDEFSLQAAVVAVGPVGVAIDASHVDFQLYKGGVYSNALCSKVVVNHAALVTGYDNDKAGAYWMVKNSWGTSWGQGGYVKMAKFRSNMCGIATRASYPTV